MDMATTKKRARANKPPADKLVGSRPRGKGIHASMTIETRGAIIKKLSAFYRATDLERVQIIRKGVPASALAQLSLNMGVPRERLYSALSLPRSSVERKIKANSVLTPEQSERVLGLERLIGQVQVMVEQSGDPTNFDASRWVSEWLDRPLPALGGASPADFMDTMEGQVLVSGLLAKSQSGAYA